MKPIREAGETVLVHSSDIHVDEGRAAASDDRDGTAGLRAVLETARSLNADIALLAGDTFETNQLGAAIIDRVGRAAGRCRHAGRDPAGKP